MHVLPREERAEDQAGPGLSAALPFAALLLLGAAALAYDLRVSWRLPATADWAEAAAALRARARPGDAVQPWPPWAERSRLVVDAAPVEIEEDLRAADWVGVERLWLLALPEAPYAGLARAEEALRARGAAPGEPLAFGALRMQPWDLRAAPLAADLTGASIAVPRPELHEVDYVARRCRRVPIGPPGAPFRLEARGAAGAVAHLRAGVIGERAYDPGRPPVRVELLADGAPLASLEVPPTALRTSGWRAADAPVPPGAAERRFELRVWSPDTDRPFCVAAWSTAR